MDLRETFVKLVTDAAQDKPSRPSVRIIDGQWTLTIKGNRDKWPEMKEAACVPENATELVEGETLTVQWPSLADQIFGADGLLAQHVEGYEVRLPQIHMARLVQRAIEMGEPAIIEAGTGTGKSFAYAAIAMAMNKRVIISTSNKALQAQLYQKDIPFLCEIFPGKRVALAQGKGNYVCHANCNGKQIEDLRFAEWIMRTQTGNVEELDFAVKDVNQYTADDECTGKKCDFYDKCFYYNARAERQNADVIITNHALLVLSYLVPAANILPTAEVVVVDEAHKLADYARNALGQDFTIGSIKKVLGKAFEDGASTANAERLLQNFGAELAGFTALARDRELGIASDHEFEDGKRLASELYDVANEIWPEEDSPEDKEQIKLMKRAQRVRNLADKIKGASSKTVKGFVRWIEIESHKMINAPYDVSAFIGRMAGFETHKPEERNRGECARCNRVLTAKMVHVLDGIAYGPDCIRHVDLFGDAEVVPLHDWLNHEEQIEVDHTPTSIIFTSATIAAPTLSHFMRECGLDHGFQMIADSPFNYEANALLYVPNGETPTPDSAQYPAYMVQEMRKLVLGAKGGAFLLFTSYRNMQHAVSALRHDFGRAGLEVYVQGELPKGEIAKRFRSDGNAVLFATKSFWEGISIEGAALRLVVIDKLPFAAPSPMSKARETTVNNAFFEMLLPEAIIDLKQGAGRLIRKQTDYGAIAILDSRVRLKSYGRSQVIPALPPAKLVSSSFAVDEFFHQRREVDIDLEPAIQHAVELLVDDLDELPF